MLGSDNLTIKFESIIKASNNIPKNEDYISLNIDTTFLKGIESSNTSFHLNGFNAAINMKS